MDQRREQKHRFKVYNHSGEVYGIFEAGDVRRALYKALKQAGRLFDFWIVKKGFRFSKWIYAVQDTSGGDAVYFTGVQNG